MIPIALHEKTVQNCFYQIQRQGLKSLAITATRREEGVSTFSYALARRAAATGIKVLLIDFNIPHPGQTKKLALQRTYWMPQKNFKAQKITPLSNTNLSFLSAPSNLKDQWAFQDQKSIRAMLEDLEREYDLIIADMPSILEPDSNLQTEIMCAAFEKTLLMVLSSHTVETEISKVKLLLDEAKVPLLGTIMNDPYTPSLVEEILRQLDKIEHPFGGFFNFSFVTNVLKKWVAKNAFLNQSL